MCPSPEPAAVATSAHSRQGCSAQAPFPTEAGRRDEHGNGAASEASPAVVPAARHSAIPADLERGLHKNPKYLPCRFLYDDRGSQLYEQITRLPEYYPYRTEKQLLEAHADAIASQIPAGSVVVELGCGDSTKTSILLAALLRRHAGSAECCGRTNGTSTCGDGGGGIRLRPGPGAAGDGEHSGTGSRRSRESSGEVVQFVGIDCSAEALRQTARSLQRLLPQLPQEQVELVEAEYLPGIAAVRARHPDAMLTILWLGSSVGNFSAGEASEFLAALRCAAGERCQLLLATDSWKDPEVLRRAYNDSQGVSAAFILNGMHHALCTLGHPDAACSDLFDYDPVVNAKQQQVEMYVRARRRVADVLPGLHIQAGERVLVEISRKFTPQVVSSMALDAGFCLGAAWACPLYSLHLLLPPALALERCWADTDSIFAAVADWEAQPIALRHPWLFYIAHCATFARLKMLPQEAPSELDVLFNRGMDPLVQDPSVCHDHPAIPQRWPERAAVEAHVAAARRQVATAVQGGTFGADGEGPLARMRRLWLVLEHERQHQETLCYMAAQQRRLDAASAATGGVVVLSTTSAPGSGSAVPFYLQQCSYARASTAACAGQQADRVDSEAGVADGQSGLPGPATPARQYEHIREHVDLLSLGAGSASSPGIDKSTEIERCMDVKFVRVPGAKVWVGADPACPHGFLWDCELGRRGPLALPGLQVAAGPITVAQFRRFVFEERGYARPELWDDEAHRHLCASGHSMPATWSLLDASAVPPAVVAARSAAPSVAASSGGGGGGWQQLWVHMPEGSYRAEDVADCPVYVSLAEAQAYARLHGARLMSEAEWELAASSCAAAEGALRLLGSGGWEWTTTPLEPLPGFRPDPLYPQFSADFFDGQHYVLRGASTCTHPSLARRSFRNFYQRLYPFVFAKFRLVKD